MIMLSVENSLVFPTRAKPTAFGCCESSPTTQCNTGLFGVGIGREVGTDINMTSAMWGPLGHNIDNQALVDIINKDHSACKDMISIIKILFLLALKYVHLC